MRHDVVPRTTDELQRELAATSRRLAKLESGRWWRLRDAIATLVNDPGGVRTWTRKFANLRHVEAPLEASTRDMSDEAAQEAADAAAVHTASRRFGRHDYEAVVAVLDPIVAARPGLEAAALLRDAHIRLGNLPAAIAALRTARTLAESSSLQRQERMLVGQVRETDPGWLPDIGTDIDGRTAPGAPSSPAANSKATAAGRPERPPTATRPSAAALALHVAVTSLPHHHDELAQRLAAVVAAQRATGMDPHVVTGVGFPRLRTGDDGWTSTDAAGIADPAHTGDPAVTVGPPDVDVVAHVRHHRLDLGPRIDPRRLPNDRGLSIQAALVRQLADELRPEVVHTSAGRRRFDTALVGRAVARHLDVPHVHEVGHLVLPDPDTTWWGDERGDLRTRRLAQEEACIRSATHVATTTEALRNLLTERGLEPAAVTVVPDVVDLRTYDPARGSNEAGQAPRPRAEVVLGCIGPVHPWTGVAELVHVVAGLRTRGHDVAGLVVGDGPDVDAVRALAGQLGVADHVVLTGPAAGRDLVDRHAAIDVLLMPWQDRSETRFASAPSALRSLAMARPVVATDLPGLRELVGSGDGGRLLPSPTVVARLAGVTTAEARVHAAGEARNRWLDACAELMDPSLRQRLGDSGRAWVTSHRSPDVARDAVTAVHGSL